MRARTQKRGYVRRRAERRRYGKMLNAWKRVIRLVKAGFHGGRFGLAERNRRESRMAEAVENGYKSFTDLQFHKPEHGDGK